MAGDSFRVPGDDLLLEIADLGGVCSRSRTTVRPIVPSGPAEVAIRGPAVSGRASGSVHIDGFWLNFGLSDAPLQLDIEESDGRGRRGKHRAKGVSTARHCFQPSGPTQSEAGPILVVGDAGEGIIGECAKVGSEQGIGVSGP
ncbi:hypothetical protein [Streptomyces sp. NPDC088135]|uniref:hypothetical protein n=1 Tax=Streptomyces sp. NPDC088135 TaxID=3160993 RepID=UPI003427B7BD